MGNLTYDRFFPATTSFLLPNAPFADLAIAVIFYPIKKSLKNFVHIIRGLSHSDIEFESKNEFCNYVKKYPKIQ